MPEKRSFVSANETKVTVSTMWQAIRRCELNVRFHRDKGKGIQKQIQLLDISSITLAAVAGVGILAGIHWVSDSVWAIIAFASGVVNQLRPIFRLSDKMLEEFTLEKQYTSLLSFLTTLMGRAQEVDGLTPELHSQFQLGIDRYNVLRLEHDQTQYTPEETKPLMEEVNRLYPPDSLWMPAYALESKKEDTGDVNIFIVEQPPQTGGSA
jgi:hypothetical protein